MKKNVILSGVMVSVLLVGTLVCHAEKWDKNDFTDKNIESGFYDADSVKVKGKAVSWTEKYLFTNDGIKDTKTALSKHQACKKSIAKKGDSTQYQIDYQIEGGKYRGVAKRYYNKSNELLCTDANMGREFDTSWNKIQRGSPMEKAFYDLVTKYKVNIK